MESRRNFLVIRGFSVYAVSEQSTAESGRTEERGEHDLWALFCPTELKVANGDSNDSSSYRSNSDCNKSGHNKRAHRMKGKRERGGGEIKSLCVRACVRRILREDENTTAQILRP